MSDGFYGWVGIFYTPWPPKGGKCFVGFCCFASSYPPIILSFALKIIIPS